MDWAREGLIDVIQYNVLSPGFARWLEIGRWLDSWGIKSAPHHYGSHYGNYAACHLAAAIEGFTFAEWDEAVTPGLGTSAYVVSEGRVLMPSAPGFGLTVDDEIVHNAVEQHGCQLP